MTSSDDIIASMAPLCQTAWHEYEDQYAGGMFGGRLTAVRAFKAAWDAAVVACAANMEKSVLVVAAQHGEGARYVPS